MATILRKRNSGLLAGSALAVAALSLVSTPNQALAQVGCNSGNVGAPFLISDGAGLQGSANCQAFGTTGANSTALGAAAGATGTNETSVGFNAGPGAAANGSTNIG